MTKIKFLCLSILFAISCTLFVDCYPAFADEAVVDPGLGSAIAEIVKALVGKYPILSGIFTVMGMLRFLLKPTLAFARVVVGATVTKKDDQILDKVETSKAMKVVMFILDWIFSIKPLKPSPEAK